MHLSLNTLQRTPCDANPSNQGTLSEKKVLSRTLNGSSAQRSVGTFKGDRSNLLQMVLGGTLPEEP